MAPHDAALLKDADVVYVNDKKLQFTEFNYQLPDGRRGLLLQYLLLNKNKEEQSQNIIFEFSTGNIKFRIMQQKIVTRGLHYEFEYYYIVVSIRIRWESIICMQCTQ